MSILLDALKKSEEQRQQGSASNTGSPAGSLAAGSSALRKWRAWALLAVTAVIVAWFGWRQYGQPETASVSSSADPSETTAAPVAGQARAVAIEQPVQAAGQRTPVETFAPDGGAGHGEEVVLAAESAPAALEKSQVNQSFTDFEASPGAASSAQQAPLETASSSVAETAAPQVKQPPRSTRPPAAATEPITFWELPQGIRDGLPDLRITVLVFAERPADRFVLIGGQRRVENDRLQDDLVLEEIRRDGAVFTYRNYRFLVKG